MTLQLRRNLGERDHRSPTNANKFPRLTRLRRIKPNAFGREKRLPRIACGERSRCSPTLGDLPAIDALDDDLGFRIRVTNAR